MVWTDFAASIDPALDFILFDGSLLHHPINDMMRNYHITGEQAIPHVTTLLRALGDCPRRIVYLETDDLAGQLARAYADRRQAPPTAEDLCFWETRRCNDRIVLAHLEERCTIHDVSSQNWTSVRQQIKNSLL